MQGLRVASRASGRFDHCILRFGPDSPGDAHVLVTKNTGPTGATGTVFRLVRRAASAEDLLSAREGAPLTDC